MRLIALLISLVVLLFPSRLHAQSRSDVALSPIEQSTRVQSHVYPGIVSIGGAVVVTWREIDSIDRDVVVTWNMSRDSVSGRSVYQPPPPELSLPPGAYDITATHESQTANIPQPGEVILEYQQRYMADFTYTYPNPHMPSKGRSFDYRIAYARPGKGGWLVIDTIRSARPRYSTDRGVYGRALGFDPDEATAYLLYTDRVLGGSGDASRRLIVAPRDTASHTVELPLGVIATKRFVPIGGRSFVALDSVTGTLFDGNRARDTFAHDFPSVATLRYTALRGPRFLASWVVDDQIQLRTIDSNGNELARASIRCAATSIPQSSGDYCVAESSVDSSIAIVTGGSHGVHASRLTKRLFLIYADTLVSEYAGSVMTPAAILIGDTLAVVWEDSRSATSRIYGAARPGLGPRDTATAADVPEIKELSKSVSVAPNPTSGVVHVTIATSVETRALLEVTDALGQTLLVRDLVTRNGDRETVQLNLAHWPSGAYLVRVHVGAATTTRIVVKQ